MFTAIWLALSRVSNFAADRRPGGNLAMGVRDRLCCYLWLLNHETKYLLYSPLPFIKAAAMVPVVSRYAGRSIRDVWRELDSRSAKLLVLATYPLAITLIMFHATRIFQK
jgi:hypothetical protein